MAKAANVTKYDAGGSGDNYIDDGYIKTVEKIWLDNYTITSNMTASKQTITIAQIPDNKKITGIDIMVQTSASQTNGTISVGNSAGSADFMAATDVTHNLTMSSISIPGQGLTGNAIAAASHYKEAAFQKVVSGTEGTITMTLNNWTAGMSTGTIKTKVRYT